MTRKRTPNEPIGTCPCPVCQVAVPLHKYRAYSDDTARSRRAGKLYLNCPTDGMFQGQEYLLEHGTINARPPAGSAPETERAAPDTVQESPSIEPPPIAETEPTPKAETDAAGGWGFYE